MIVNLVNSDYAWIDFIQRLFAFEKKIFCPTKIFKEALKHPKFKRNLKLKKSVWKFIFPRYESFFPCESCR